MNTPIRKQHHVRRTYALSTSLFLLFVSRTSRKFIVNLLHNAAAPRQITKHIPLVLELLSHVTKARASAAVRNNKNQSTFPSRYRQPSRSSHHRSTSIHSRTHSSHSAIPYRLWNRTRTTNAGPTSSSIAASSAALEHTEPATDRPTLRERPESRRLKRCLRGLSEEGAREFQLPLAGNIVLIRIRISERSH